MPSLNPIQQLNVGKALGGASGAGVMQTDANGLILDPTTVALSSLADLANARVIGRYTAGTGDPEAVTMAQLAALLKTSLDAQAQTYSVLQTFAAALGLVLTPGTAPAAPVEGQLWFESSGSKLMVRDSTASIPIIEIGTWTPTVRPDTAGDFSVSYTTQTGTYLKIGRRLWIDLNLVTSAMTWTTSSGTMRLYGLPYTMSSAAGQLGAFPLATYGGLSLATTAGYHLPVITPSTGGTTTMLFRRLIAAGNSFTGTLALNSTNGFLSGQNVTLIGSGYIGRTNEA